VHASFWAGRSTTGGGGEFTEPDVTRASARSRKTSFTTDARHGFVRHVCDQRAGGYAVPTCSPIHVIFSPEMVFMVISVLTLFANYFDTGILSARRFSSMTRSKQFQLTACILPKRQSQALRLGPRLRLERTARRYNPAVLSLLQSQHRLRRLADYIEHNFG
jgi:hypothetical protein